MKVTDAERLLLPTKQEIEAAQTGRGGWNRKTLAQWGVPWPPPKGWRRTLEHMRTGRVERPRGWGGPVVTRSLLDLESAVGELDAGLDRSLFLDAQFVPPTGTPGEMLRYYRLVSLHPLRYEEVP